jgi:cobalt-zinc-cadmium efflux system protein
MSAANEQNQNNKNKKLFIWAAGLTLAFALIEIIYGFLSGSLMIIGDGVHMSSDAISLILSLVAAIMATKAATKKRTFGYKRFEPIAAFINGLTLVLIPIYIIFEAIKRMVNPVEIVAEQMIAVGVIGLLINALVGYILSKGDANLNMRSAILHVIADMITSMSAVIVALAIMFFDLTWLDPVGSILTSIIIIRGGISITKESFNILMEGTPEGYSVDKIKQSLQSISEEMDVQDVKVWCVNEAEVYTMIRVKSSEGMVKNLQKAIKDLVTKSTKIPSENIFVDLN